MKDLNFLQVIQERTKFLNRATQTAQAKEDRKQKLIDKNLYIDEAAPKYRETYTGNKA